MRVDKYSAKAVKRALIVYFETYPLIRNAKTPEEIRKALSQKDYGIYTDAMYILDNSHLKGEEIIKMLLGGDLSNKRHGLMAKTLSNHQNIRITIESIGLKK